MEHKIGEIITLPDGRKAEVVEDGFCVDCIFHKTLWVQCRCRETEYVGQCYRGLRSDHKSIAYKEVKEETK